MFAGEKKQLTAQDKLNFPTFLDSVFIATPLKLKPFYFMKI